MSEAPKKLWVEWPKANHLDVAYDEPPVSEHDMAQSAYTRSDLCITRAEADAMVAAERERAAKWCEGEADKCEDARKWSDLRTQYAKDCKAAAFALRNAAWAIRKGETP